jgi:hypothetical protein
LSGPESALVAECQKVAEAMGAMVAFVGQQKAKGSGTTIGYPDCTVICAGQVRFVEFKRPKTADHPKGYVSVGQRGFIENAAEQGVTVHVVDRVEDFVSLVNSCRKPRREE